MAINGEQKFTYLAIAKKNLFCDAAPLMLVHAAKCNIFDLGPTSNRLSLRSIR